jgi:uncharacterized protein
MSAPLQVSVARLRSAPGGRREVVTTTTLDGLKVTGSAVDPLTPIIVRAVLEAVGEGVLVTATIATTWSGSCRRCLRATSGPLVAEVTELCSAQLDPELGYAVEGDVLDLEPITSDACILELPLAPLCSEDCAGLCPHCGVDLNVERCSCRADLDPRWAALDVLDQRHEVGSAEMHADGAVGRR